MEEILTKEKKSQGTDSSMDKSRFLACRAMQLDVDYPDCVSGGTIW